MNRKVTLTEIVGTKIVYALILVSYYWMWARTDWKDYYVTIQRMMGFFLLVFFIFQAIRIKKYKTEGVDELAEQNLKRCDSVCLKLFLAVMVVVAWICGIAGHGDILRTGVVGWMIVLTILALAVIRTVMFKIMDSKGV